MLVVRLAQKWHEAPLILCKGNLEDVLVCKVKEWDLIAFIIFDPVYIG